MKPPRAALGVLAAMAMMGGTPGPSFGPTAANPNRNGPRNGAPFNDGFDAERLARAEKKRERKRWERLVQLRQQEVGEWRRRHTRNEFRRARKARTHQPPAAGSVGG